MTIRTHRLKSWPEHFAALQRGEKDFEIRENDRTFQVGDLLVLQEFIPVRHVGLDYKPGHPDGTYTGKAEHRFIKHIHDDAGKLQNGYIVLGLRNVQLGDTGEDFERAIIDTSSGSGGGCGEPREPLGGEDRRIERVVPRTVPRFGAGDGDVPLRYAAMEPNKNFSQVIDPVPADVYWSEQNQNFYSTVTGRGQDDAFFEKWHDRCMEFPTRFSGQTAAAREFSEQMRGASVVWTTEDRVRQAVKDGLLRETEAEKAARNLTDHEHELLTILSEECAEVIIQISKLKRFGRVATDRSVTPNMKYDNIAILGLEIGHIQHMINVVQACELIYPSSVKAGENEKGEKLRRYLQTKRTYDPKQPLEIDEAGLLGDGRRGPPNGLKEG